MNIQFIRHATMIFEYNQKRILVDPMLSPKGAMEPVNNSPNQVANPLVELPFSISELLNVDAVLITHTHRDHFDDTAAKVVPKNLPILCQPEDEHKLTNKGFVNVKPIHRELTWNGIKLTRTGGCHGTGEIGISMGPVSGYILASPSEPTLYLAGDTIWCNEVKKALALYQPQITILYAGSAQFLVGDPITMSAKDVAEVCSRRKDMNVVTVHMEAFNHCILTREELRRTLAELGLQNQVAIPLDGEKLCY